MKLSDLVLLKNQLEEYSSLSTRSNAITDLEKISQLIQSNNLSDEISNNKVEVDKAFARFEHELDQIKLRLKGEIEIAEKPWFMKSYELYDGELKSTAETILNLRKTPDPNIEVFKTRLKTYSDWKYSAMIIRPGLETFIEDLVSFDPLYLVDLNYDYLVPALSRFNEQYQNRLRTYTIKEDINRGFLKQLPNNQFSICLAYNYFNFRPFEVIKKYFSEIYSKLKPGGTLIMTFNDCDRASAVKLVEQYYCSYTPGYLVRELAESMGYEIAYSWNDVGPSTWIELRKPGVLTTIKGGQSLAKIVPK